MGKQIIHASFDLKYTKDPESEYYDISPSQFNILNSLTKSIPIDIISNQFNIQKKLVISTNGVDGYGYDNTNFKLNPIYYAGQKIYFVCRLKTLDNFPVKNIPPFRLGADNFGFSLSAVRDSNGNDVAYTLLDEYIDGVDYSGGYFKGSITIDEIPPDVTSLNSVTISLNYDPVELTTNGLSGANFLLQGSSGKTYSFAYGFDGNGPVRLPSATGAALSATVTAGATTPYATILGAIPTAFASVSGIGKEFRKIAIDGTAITFTLSGSNVIPLDTDAAVQQSLLADLNEPNDVFSAEQATGSTGAKDIKLYPVVNTPTFGVITGESNEFNVHPKTGLYSYRKINEDNDQEQNYKDLRFQNILQYTDDFFTNFLGGAVGNKNSSTDSLGIKIYEKISNFTSNNTDVNTSNVTGLLSMLESLKVDYETYNIEFPASLSRIVDNASISLSLQKGNINYFNQDFDDKGQIISNVLGINKGKELPLMTTLLHTGDDAKPIVAYEKFSKIYTLLNTNLLSSYNFRYLHPETNTYALSDYNKYWGWGLIIPPQIGTSDDFFIVENSTYNTSPSAESLYQNVLNFQDNFGRLTTQSYDKEKRDPSNIGSFYTFYEYLSTPEGSNIQKFIDFDNPNTDVGALTSYSSYIGSGGVLDDIILNNLVTNTIFISGITTIEPNSLGFNSLESNTLEPNTLEPNLLDNYN